MNKILLTLHNRTKWDVVFLYNKAEYPVIAGKREVIKVAPGHYVYAIPPRDARVARQNIPVEHDQTAFKLEKNSIIECNLIKWQLDLTIKPSLLK
jgi:hypothetical protein